MRIVQHLIIGPFAGKGGKARIACELQKEVPFLLIKIGQAQEERDSVSLSRSLLFDPEAVLAFNNEAERLFREMQKNAARQLLLKLQAHAYHETQQGSDTDTDDPSNDMSDMGLDKITQ